MKADFEKKIKRRFHVTYVAFQSLVQLRTSNKNEKYILKNIKPTTLRIFLISFTSCEVKIIRVTPYFKRNRKILIIVESITNFGNGIQRELPACKSIGTARKKRKENNLKVKLHRPILFSSSTELRLKANEHSECSGRGHKRSGCTK